MPKPENIVPHQYPKGVSGNPNGRPPRVVTAIMRELQAAGYERVTKGMIAETVERLFGVDQGKLLELAGDEQVPVLVRTVARDLADPGKARDVLLQLMDRIHGRVLQPNEGGAPQGQAIDLRILFKDAPRLKPATLEGRDDAEVLGTAKR